ncbi:MAG: prephenate dehydrogenase/arogenate dehydrogenase family protein [Deltaproteobacteria bacterium]|nr:prephenate dehydrogenase/arogenate dehydrogenase family protein [Deltaproteobacteria bacterium]
MVDEAQHPASGTPGAPLRPLPAARVAFVGLGLVGGSLAKATRRAWPGVTVIGVDRPAILDVARDAKLIDEAAPLDAAADLVAGADLVVFCLPVLGIAQCLERLAPALRVRAVATDTGSTKRVIVETAARLGLRRFVGGHPMAGKSQGGLAHADAALVVGARWFLCPAAGVDPAALLLLRQWARDLGARPVELDAAEHDRTVALTSHLPHVVANAIAEAVLDGGALDAAGGSLRDVLKVAGAPFETWGDTLATNAEAVRAALEDLRERLGVIADSLEDRERMRDLFARGRACRERITGGERTTSPPERT